MSSSRSDLIVRTRGRGLIAAIALSFPPRADRFDVYSWLGVLHPVPIEARIAATGHRLRLPDPDERRGSHTLAKHERCLRCEGRELIEEGPVDARHDVLEVAEVLRVLKPVHDEAAALRQDGPRKLA